MQRVTNELSESAVTTKINEPAQIDKLIYRGSGWAVIISSEQRVSPLSHDYAGQQDVRKQWLS